MLLKNGILADIQDNLIRKRRGSDVLPFFYIRKKRKSLLVKKTIPLRNIFFGVKNTTVNSVTSVKCKRLRLFHAKNVVDCIVRKSKSPQQECRRVRILSRRPRPTEL